MSDLRADGSLKSKTCTRMAFEDTLKPVEPTVQATDVDVEKGPVDVGSEQNCAAGDVYDRFSPRRKNVIVCIVSFSAFLSPVTSSSFLPSIPQIAHDTSSNTTVIGYTIAVFIVVMGSAPLIWAPLSVFYGRRPVYLASLPIFIMGCFGVSQSNTVGQIIGTRVLQAIGSSSVLAVGAGSVGDIYRPTERATAMGWYYSGILLGPAFAPTIAGLFQEYTKQTWRSMQYCLAGFGIAAFLLTLFCLPETFHGKTPHQVACEERGVRFVPYWFNPFRSVLLLRWPNICMMACNASCQLVSAFALLVPLSTVFKTRFNINNSAILGLLYLSTGVGNLIGTRAAGVFSDRTVKKWIEKRGYRRPEDRLRVSVWVGLTLMPMPIIIYGWVVEKKIGGLALPLVLLAINGFGLMLVLNPGNTYCVDAMQQRSAEVVAVSNFIRYLWSAGASAAVLPLIDTIGFGWTNTLMTFISYGGMICVILTIRYGAGWRETANAKHGVTYKEADENRPMTEDLVELEVRDVDDAEDKVTEMRGSFRIRRAPSALPQPSDLLRRTHSLTEPHH